MADSHTRACRRIGMCGIAGIISLSEAPHDFQGTLDRLRAAISHRGPDGYGFHVGNDRGFLNVRLAIVDRVGGKQPMYSSDGTKGIVFNGEIYNFSSLRAELERDGVLFSTHSDTEVILKLFERDGISCLAKLNGMFAVCLWDDSTGDVFLARDHLGIKPLYLYQDRERLLFASELQAITAVPDLDLSWDARGLQDYLTFRYMQAPFTCFSSIRRLEAGTYLHIRQGRVTQWRYYDLSYETQSWNQISVEDAQEHGATLLREAVRSQLMGEVPVGILLSGGLDSSAIASCVAELGANLTTFNVGFPDVNEFEYSRAVAQHYGLQHVEVEVTVPELLSKFDRIIKAIDEPMADPACFPLYWLCLTVREHVTVVLSGEGGDELFGGYPQYRSSLYHDINYSRRFEHFLEQSYYFLDAANYLVEPRHVQPVQYRNRKYFEEQGPLNSMLCFDMKTWLSDNLMMKADKIAMAHSLEGRFPFLDLPFFEFSTRLPENAKVHPDGTSKWLLRKLMAKRLPAQILERPKMGFSVPLHKFVMALRERVIDTLDDHRLDSLWQVLRKDAVRFAIVGYYEGQHSDTLRAWTVTVLVLWAGSVVRAR